MDHSATIRRLYEAINVHDLDAIGALMADDFVDHEELPGLPSTREGTLTFFRGMFAAFPDFRMEPEQVLVDSDTAVARVTATGTHRGEFMGMPASGRTFSAQAIDIIRFGDDGLAREHWGVYDQMAMMQQLGALPPAG
jgi:steroid delta-isomerase-like uncharacterized protein